MSQIYIDKIKRRKQKDTQLGILNIYIFCWKFSRRGECCQRYIVSVFENTPKNLVVQGRVQLEHSSHIVKVGKGHIVNLQKRALCFLLNDYDRTYEDLPEKSVYPNMNLRRQRTLCIEIYKALNKLNSGYMNDIFKRDIF